MATYSRAMVVFGLGILLVCLCCMKATEAKHDESDSGVTIHAIKREHHAGCHAKHSDAGEECTSEDDHLGLYSDVDDTFRVIKNIAAKGKLQEGSSADYEDSPDIAHNNVNVLGH